MSDTISSPEQLALRLIRFLRRTKLSPHHTLPAIEELAGQGEAEEPIESILSSLSAQEGGQCKALLEFLSDARFREAVKARNRRFLGEEASEESSLLLGDVPTNVSTAWSDGSELRPILEEAVQLLQDLRFLDAQDAKLPAIRALLAGRYDVARQRLRPRLAALVGLALDELPADLQGEDSSLRRCLEEVQTASHERTRRALAEDGPLEITLGDHAWALAELKSALSSADVEKRRRVFDAVLDWPDVNAATLIRQMCQTPTDQERAELVLTLRFGSRGSRGWHLWSSWLDQQHLAGRTEFERLTGYVRNHAGAVAHLWYAGQSEPDPEALKSLESHLGELPEKGEFIDRWAEQLSSEEWNAIDPESAHHVSDPALIDALSRMKTERVVTPPPLPPPLPVAPAVQPEPKPEPKKEEPKKPSFWEQHVQPLLTENWYVFAGIAMVIVGASLLAYYTWDKAWWIRYTIMPALLGGFTWALAGLADWVERKGEEFRSMAAMLRGAAIGLLPLNFMVVSLLAKDPNVPSKVFMALLMGSVYLILFGWGAQRWCAKVAEEFRWRLGGVIVFVNALVIVGPMSAVFGADDGAGAVNIAVGFYAGFTAMCLTTVRFVRHGLTRELAEAKLLPWFFGGALGVTFLQSFAWAHGMAEMAPPARTYSVMVVLLGWLVLFVERRNIELFDRGKSYRAESFIGFALIFFGILLSAADPALRVATFFLGGCIWMYQSASRKAAIHHWIALTLLILGGASIATLEGFPREWMAGVGFVMGVLLGISRRILLTKQRDQLATACAGMQMSVMVLTTVVAVLAQWHFRTPPAPTGMVLTLIGLHFLYVGLREERLTWVHTAMMVMAVALPFYGFVDLEKRTFHGNTLVFGLAMLSFIWLILIAALRRPLLYAARSTVLWLYGSVAVVAMLVRVVLEQGAPVNPLWYLNYMDYTGPLLMTAALVLATFHSRSLVPALMAVFIVVILFPELRANLRGTFVDRVWGSGFGSACSSVGLVAVCFFLRPWKLLEDMRDGDRFFGRDAFPLRRTDHTLFTWPTLAAAAFLAAKVDTWNLARNFSLSGVPVKTAWAVALTAVTWTLFGAYHGRNKGAWVGCIAGAFALFLGVWLLNWEDGRPGHWAWSVLVTGLVLQVCVLGYRHLLSARMDWVTDALTTPTEQFLKRGSMALTVVSLMVVLFSAEHIAFYCLSVFLIIQLIRFGLAERKPHFSVLLYLQALATGIALAHPGAGILLVRLEFVSLLQTVFAINLGFLILSMLRPLSTDESEAPASTLLLSQLRSCAGVITLLMGMAAIGNALGVTTHPMDGVWLCAIGVVLVFGLVELSLPFITVAMILTYCGVHWPLVETVTGMGMGRLEVFCLPWRWSVLSLAMVLILRLGMRGLAGFSNLPFLPRKRGAIAQNTLWVEAPAVGFALIAAAMQSADVGWRNEPVQTLAPYLGALTLGLVGWFRRQGAFYTVAAALLFVGNLHIVRVFLGDGLRANGLSDVHIICLGIGFSLAQVSLVRRFVKEENGGAILNQSGLVMAGAILVLLSANYLVHPDLLEITNWRFFISGAMALMTGWYFRWAWLSPGVGEQPYVNVCRGFYHFGVAMTIWCWALLIPSLRMPAIVLLVLALPTFYFYLRAELGLKAASMTMVGYRNSGAVMGFVILALYTFKGAFQMLLFPEANIDLDHYHYNAPLIVVLAFVLLRLHGLGGTSWLAFYGGLALMVGSYFSITWIRGLSPFAHYLAAAWTAIALGQFWIAVSITRSPLRTFVQRIALLDDPTWYSVRKAWGLFLSIAAHLAVLPAMLNYDNHPLMIAPLWAGLASVLVMQGIARRSAVYFGFAGLELLVSLHADFFVESYLPRDLVVWVLLALWLAAMVVNRIRPAWMPTKAVGWAALGSACAVGLHVLYHGPSSDIGWWAALGATVLATLTPMVKRGAEKMEEIAAVVVLLAMPTWLVFFGLFNFTDNDLTTGLLLTVFTIFATGAGARWFQLRWYAGYLDWPRVRFRLFDQCCALMGSRGLLIEQLTAGFSLAAGIGIQALHYQWAFTGFELGILLTLFAGLAFVWWDAGRRSESVLPIYLMQAAIVGFFVVARRYLMLTTGFWNYEYDVWAMLAVSFCLAGLKPVFDRREGGVRGPMLGAMFVMPVLACSWVLTHNLGTNAALLVAGLYSLKFAFLGKENKESPYNIVAIVGFVAFILIGFWGKLEIRYVHAYVLPVGIAVLVLLQMFGRHVDPGTRQRVRFMTLITMIGSAGYYALIDDRHEIAFNLIMIGLCLVAMLMGSFFRIRLYLSVGMAGLLIDLASIVFKVMVNMERTSRMTAIGSLVLLIGAGLVFGAIYYKTHREMLNLRLNNLRERLGAWE